MKPVERDRRPLEPGGLEPVAGREQDSEHEPGDEAGPAERPEPRRGRNRESRGGDRKADAEEREERVDRDRVLDLDERDAPDGRDSDEREERHGRSLAACAAERLNAERRPRNGGEHGPVRAPRRL